MSAHSAHQQRDVSQNQFRDRNFINQGNVQGNVYYGLPHPPARAEVVRVIPYPRNEDLVHRGDLIDRLDKLLPQNSGSHSAALWGLGGSGKTQIALDYAYRRCGADDECCVFWVHADNEATFLADYKTIGKKLGVDERLDGSDLLDAVRSGIEARTKWMMILDNADDLSLFGVGQQIQEGVNQNLHRYIPCTSQGTVLWTSRDTHITGTLVGARRGIEVRSMTIDEAKTLLAKVRDEPSAAEEAPGEARVDALLEELQCLPLAISQAAAYMRRMSLTAEQYLGLLRQGKTRWEVLKVSDADRHRRPEVSNSVLETWRISTERIRVESEMSYRMLHVVAYVDSQDIPYDLMAAAASRYHVDDANPTGQSAGLEVLGAIARLKEFSFLSLRQGEDNGLRYEMHKLVQEAVRYGLRVSGPMETILDEAPVVESGPERGEAYYSGIALQVVDGLFPPSEPTSWERCEQYMTHAIRVGEWAEVSGTETETSALLARVSDFLYRRGRWREKEPVDRRAWGLRREVLGEKHPDTISSMASLAATYGEQGRYSEAESLHQETLDLRREVLGEKHRDTIRSMSDLAATYFRQGRYGKAEGVFQEVLDLRREIVGEKHPDTISSMASLAATYSGQGRSNEAEPLKKEALDFRREVLGERHPDTIWSMSSLAATYHAQGRYDEAEGLKDEALNLRREVLGEKHPDTISSMADLGATYHAQGRYDEGEEISVKVLDLRREVLGEKHPNTISSMASLGATYHAQGRYDEAEGLKDETLNLRREVLGEKHPDTISSMADLGATYHAQGRYDEGEEISVKVLDLRREVLGEKHPNTIRSIASLAATYHAQGRYDEAEGLKDEALNLRREVLGEKHPNTIWSMSSLAATYAMQGHYNKAESLYQEALDLGHEVLGEKHPNTISSMANLGATYHAQGRYDEAERLHQTALDLRRHVLGENHPDTMQSMTYLASTQEVLQQLPSLVESAQSLAVAQVGGSGEEGEPRHRSLWEVMNGKVDGKVGRFRKWRSHRSRGPE